MKRPSVQSDSNAFHINLFHHSAVHHFALLPPRIPFLSNIPFLLPTRSLKRPSPSPLSSFITKPSHLPPAHPLPPSPHSTLPSTSSSTPSNKTNYSFYIICLCFELPTTRLYKFLHSCIPPLLSPSSSLSFSYFLQPFQHQKTITYFICTLSMSYKCPLRKYTHILSYTFLLTLLLGAR